MAELEPAPEPVAAASRARTAAEAFDALYTHAAPFLVRQTYLLTGRRILAREAVERAFQQAWQNWPEVAVDPDPAGWVRAAAYEYAMSPWHGLRPGKRQPEAPPATPEDRELLGALLDLPPVYRRTLLLYDGVGLDLPETAAETEASTPAAANRILHAREAVAQRLPDLAVPEQLHLRLSELAGSEKLDAPVSTVVRSGGERRTRLWTRAAVAFTVFIIGATALTVRMAPTHYEPVPAPGSPIMRRTAADRSRTADAGGPGAAQGAAGEAGRRARAARAENRIARTAQRQWARTVTGAGPLSCVGEAPGREPLS